MHVYICIDADGFIEGAARSLEGAKALTVTEAGATITWTDNPGGGSYAVIDRHNGWGAQHWATINKMELVD